MSDLTVLMFSAISIGLVHTILGPDHYLPFIVMGRANRWSTLKTSLITVLCGVGHVASSVILGFVGIALGLAVTQVSYLESVRGNLAAWALIAFGLAYFVWGMRRAWRNKPHEHAHVHADGTLHVHQHVHVHEHAHVHPAEEKKNLTPWILFTIFVLGPCEPLIPLLMYPAAKHNLGGVFLVAAVFGVVTVATMLSVVLVALKGLYRIRTTALERYTHAIAGATIFLSGLGIQVLGL